MKIIGLTGRSGSGKGLFCKIASGLGVPCLDTDIVARNVVMPGKPCLSELCQYFGDEILQSDGGLYRKRLAEIAFCDPEKLSMLNKITHKYISSEVELWLQKCRQDGVKAVVIDAPMLFESGLNKLCHYIVAIICDESKRIERIIKRDGITVAQAKNRLACQKSDEFFKENCTHIIYNNSDEISLNADIKRFFEEIFENGGDESK